MTTIENRYCVQMVNAVRSSFCFIRVASPLKSVRHGVALHPLKRYMRRWNSRRKRCFFKSKIHIYLAYTIMWMIHNGAISLLLLKCNHRFKCCVGCWDIVGHTKRFMYRLARRSLWGGLLDIDWGFIWYLFIPQQKMLKVALKTNKTYN
jgi:hypothetical protein